MVKTLQFHLSTQKLYTGVTSETLATKLLTLENYVFICPCVYHVLFFFFFTINNEHISVFKEFVFGFTIPFTLSEIIKALALVEHLSMAGF